MPYQTKDPLGTLREGVQFDPHGIQKVGMVQLAKLMGVKPVRITELVREEKLPCEIVEGHSRMADGQNGVRRFDVHRCLWLWLGGMLFHRRVLASCTSDPETDLLWAFDALLDGIDRVSRRAPSARALRLYLVSQNCEKRFDFLIDWGMKRMAAATTIEHRAILRAKARIASDLELSAGHVPVEDGNGRLNPADAFLANRGGR